MGQANVLQRLLLTMMGSCVMVLGTRIGGKSSYLRVRHAQQQGIMNDENGNALTAHYAMQGRSVGRARLSTVGRENLGSGR